MVRIGECRETFALARAEDSRLVFELDDSSDVMDLVTAVNRDSGDYIRRQRFFGPRRMLVMLSEGACKVQPFSGMPK